MAKVFTRKLTLLNSPSAADPLNMMDQIEEEGGNTAATSVPGGGSGLESAAQIASKNKKKDLNFGFDILKLD